MRYTPFCIVYLLHQFCFYYWNSALRKTVSFSILKKKKKRTSRSVLRLACLSCPARRLQKQMAPEICMRKVQDTLQLGDVWTTIPYESLPCFQGLHNAWKSIWNPCLTNDYRHEYPIKFNSVFQILVSSWCQKHCLGGRSGYNSHLNSHPHLIGYPLVFCFKTSNRSSLPSYFKQFQTCFCFSSLFKHNQSWSFWFLFKVESFSVLHSPLQ